MNKFCHVSTGLFSFVGFFFSPLKSKLIIQQTNRPFYLILNIFLILCEYVFYEHLSVVGDVVDMLKVFLSA